MTTSPAQTSYDVVIVGGAIYGSSIAWWLTNQADFDGSVLVVERDPTYEFASTSHTNSCMRQQFTAAINIQISQFAADFVKNMQSYYGGDERVPNLPVQSYGYMYLAEDEAFAGNLSEAQKIQEALGAGTQHMTADQIKAAYPFYNMDDIVAGNHNLIDEGYFDGGTVFDWWKKSARERGVAYISNEVTAMTLNEDGTSVVSVTLGSGEVIGCGTAVNASGPRAKLTAAMVGIDLPVEPRKRYTFIFDAASPLDRDLPLTIDPSGVHMRSDGLYYLAGCPPDDDGPVAFDDFEADHSIWEEKVWPVLAHRVPAFEAIKLTNMWVGHYAYNAFDQNAIVGKHTKVANFIFANGFSGHGLQQSPAIGRGVAELIATGDYQTLDLSPFGYDRIERGEKFVEKAVI